MIAVCYGFLMPFYICYGMTILAIYAAFLTGLHSGEQLFFSRLFRSISSRKDTKYQMLLIWLQRLTDCKKQFDSVMSIFPMCILANSFLGAAGYILIMRSMSGPQLWAFITEEVLDYVANIASGIALVILIEYFNSKSRAIADLAISYLTAVDSSESNYKFALISELERMSNFEYTLWSMTKLNRAFVLGFASSLITFTVMLVQIAI
ncbi:hypothetical protein HDE_01626 [Halotydeus destructor]|nr:hypothetical protein HDE_01626 [Halotydeus destructor]